MGNNQNKQEIIKDPQLRQLEKLLYESYRKLNLDFTENQITTLKLKLKDAEGYFFTKFNFFLFFNNILFQDNLSQLYNNFNAKIEIFSKKKLDKIFALLLALDDESDSLLNGEKIDFDSLFTIVFERLEINVLIFCDLSGSQDIEIKEFFSQLIDNSCLYKSGRKFDCVYFLLPTTDYLIKNSSTLTYIVTKDKETLSNANENFTKLISFEGYQNFLQVNYESTSSNNYYDKFITKLDVKLSLVMLYLKFNVEIGEFVPENEYQFLAIETMINCSNENIFYIFIDKDFCYNVNFDLFINKILASYNSKINNNNDNEIYLKIKLFLSHEEEEFIFPSFFPKIEKMIYDYFEKKNNNIPKNASLTIEYSEIKGNKKELCNYVITRTKYIFKSDIDDYESNIDFINFQKVVKHNKLLSKLNKKNIMNKIYEFLKDQTKKIQSTKKRRKESLCQICKNGMIYEKGEKFDKEYKTKFEETFLNSL